MRLGIDFGTTRTVVACSDRGNYPVVGFQDDGGDPIDWYPSIVAERDGELLFGFEAAKVANNPEWTVLRSFKRLLSTPHSSPDFEVQIGSTRIAGVELLTRFICALRDAILTSENRPKSGASSADNELVAVVATPANAHGTQRFLTLDAFRRAGFDVTALLNEPSAAGFEYTHRHRNTITARREHIIVYDLGGGTFDASLVHMAGRHHDAIITGGLTQLGGDDFDSVLALMVLEAVNLSPDALPLRPLRLLVDQCRDAKERMNPSTRRIVLDLESCLGELAPVPEVTIATAGYYDACVPLVEKTVAAMQPVIDQAGGVGEEALAGIYVVGGASSLPVVSRVLRERFGRRVHRSPYPSAAIAIGLAVAVDEEAGFRLSDRLSRHFGVFREVDGGHDVTFDPIFSRDALVPTGGERLPVRRRVYRPAHNVGQFRFVECAHLDERGVPHGEITLFNDVFFPFDVRLRDTTQKVAGVPVHRMSGEGPLIQEEYAISPHGIVQVTITDLDTGYQRAYQVGG